MSRSEGEEGEELLVWTVVFSEKASLLLRVTVVREGMSVGEGRVISNTLQSDGARIAECVTASNRSEWCELRQVYSSVHFIITTSHNQFTWVITEPECIITESNVSQFWQIYSSISFLLIHSQILHENTHRMHTYQTEEISNWVNLFIILIHWETLFNSNEAWRKLSLVSSNTPISITSNEGTFSISHTE